MRNRSHIPQTHAGTLTSFTVCKDALSDAIVAGSDIASFHRHLTFQTGLLKEGEGGQRGKATSLQTYRMFSLHCTSLCLSRHTSDLISSTGHANSGLSGWARKLWGFASVDRVCEAGLGLIFWTVFVRSVDWRYGVSHNRLFASDTLGRSRHHTCNPLRDLVQVNYLPCHQCAAKSSLRILCEFVTACVCAHES